MVNPSPCPTSKLADAGLTSTKLFTPFRLNAMPTSPLVKPVPFINVPLLPPALSNTLPSAGHQLTKPGGGGVHDDPCTLTNATTRAARMTNPVDSIFPGENFMIFFMTDGL